MSSEAGRAAANGEDERRALAPKLRFPEFRSAGAWKCQPLHSLAKRSTRRNIGEEISRVLTNSAEYGVVDQKDYFEKDVAVPGNLETYFVVEPGDYVYNPRISSAAPVGPIGKNKVGTGVMSPLYTVFRFDNDDDGFYEQVFRSSLWHAHMRLVSNSGARHDRMAISTDDFLDMPIPSPLPAERQKIADCLSSLDAVIAAEGDRLAGLRDYKKGLLQALFPTEDQGTPRQRFPEFQGMGDWTSSKLDQILTTVAPARKFQSKEYQPNGRFPIVDQGQPLIAGWTDDAASLITEPLPVIVFGDHTCVLKYVDFSFAQGADGIKILKPTDEVSVKFLFYALQAAPLQSGKYKRHFSDLIARSVAFPDVRTGEQQKVAECLTSLDKAVAALASKVDALKTHKSSLMQQLFPSFQETPA